MYWDIKVNDNGNAAILIALLAAEQLITFACRLLILQNRVGLVLMEGRHRLSVSQGPIPKSPAT